MKPGDVFLVDNEKQRQSALQSAKVLKRAGVIEFQVTTMLLVVMLIA